MHALPCLYDDFVCLRGCMHVCECVRLYCDCVVFVCVSCHVCIVNVCAVVCMHVCDCVCLYGKCVVFVCVSGCVCMVVVNVCVRVCMFVNACVFVLIIVRLYAYLAMCV